LIDSYFKGFATYDSSKSYAYLNYNTPSQLKLGRLTTKQAREHIAMQHFGKGSMLPKMEAITQFAANGRGRIGIITSP